MTKTMSTQHKRIWSDLQKKCLQRTIPLFCSSPIHMHVVIYPLFINPFVHIYLFHILIFIDYWKPRLPFTICLMHFFSDSLSANSYTFNYLRLWETNPNKLNWKVHYPNKFKSPQGTNEKQWATESQNEIFNLLIKPLEWPASKFPLQ